MENHIWSKAKDFFFQLKIQYTSSGFVKTVAQHVEIPATGKFEYRISCKDIFLSADLDKWWADKPNISP